MKQSACFIILFFCHVVLFGQQLTISDLIAKQKCNDFTCVNDFLIDKGFSFKSSKKAATGEDMYTFKSDSKISVSSNSELTSSNYVFMTLNDSSPNAISLTTPNRAYYSKLKAELTTKHFTVYTTRNSSDGDILSYYRSPTYKSIFVLISVGRKEDGDNSFTFYDIQVGGK